jgi:hypothetical protein
METLGAAFPQVDGTVTPVNALLTRDLHPIE